LAFKKRTDAAKSRILFFMTISIFPNLL